MLLTRCGLEGGFAEPDEASKGWGGCLKDTVGTLILRIGHFLCWGGGGGYFNIFILGPRQGIFLSFLCYLNSYFVFFFGVVQIIVQINSRDHKGRRLVVTLSSPLLLVVPGLTIWPWLAIFRSSCPCTHAKHQTLNPNPKP